MVPNNFTYDDQLFYHAVAADEEGKVNIASVRTGTVIATTNTMEDATKIVLALNATTPSIPYDNSILRVVDGYRDNLNSSQEVPVEIKANFSRLMGFVKAMFHRCTIMETRIRTASSCLSGIMDELEHENPEAQLDIIRTRVRALVNEVDNQPVPWDAAGVL